MTRPRKPSGRRADEPVFALHAPTRQTMPVVLASPHSGSRYHAAFLAEARVALDLLRRSEDCFVDELFADAPALGAPLISALFPRIFIDPNRNPLELDGAMFSESLPARVHADSPRVRSGLGLIARVAATGAAIYAKPLPIAEARQRLFACYFPYHRALRGLVDATADRFGFALLLDCHSMPSQAVPRPASVRGLKRAPGRSLDLVLGDRHGAACHPDFIDCAEATLVGLGYRVGRNQPYAGGFTTRHYGRPALGRHALQIEVNRALYMDETKLARRADLGSVARDMTTLVRALGAVTPVARAAE